VSVCLFVCLRCLSVCSHISKLRIQLSRNSLYVLPVAVAWSYSNGSAISYVLPVLWMTSYSRPESKTTTSCMFRPVRHAAAPEAKSSVFDFILYSFCLPFPIVLCLADTWHHFHFKLSSHILSMLWIRKLNRIVRSTNSCSGY